MIQQLEITLPALRRGYHLITSFIVQKCGSISILDVAKFSHKYRKSLIAKNIYCVFTD